MPWYRTQRALIKIVSVTERGNLLLEADVWVRLSNGERLCTTRGALEDQEHFRQWIRETYDTELHPGPMADERWKRFVNRMLTKRTSVLRRFLHAAHSIFTT